MAAHRLQTAGGYGMLNNMGVDRLIDKETLEAIGQLMDSRLQQAMQPIHTRLDGIDERLDGIDARLDRVDERLDGIDARLDRVDERLDGIDARLDRVDERLDGIDARLDGMDERFEGIEARLDTMQGDIDALKADNVKLITLEKKVDLLIEGQQNMNEKFAKLDQVADDVADLKVRVTALEVVTRDHTAQLRELRMAK